MVGSRCFVAMIACLAGAGVSTAAHAADAPAGKTWDHIAPYFSPPEKYKDQYGLYRSPLKFDDGSPVKTPEDWQRRRKEILAYWHGALGEWPAVIEKPKVEEVSREKRENFTQVKVRFDMTPKHKTEGYVLLPENASADAKRPGIVVVYYEPETAIGLNEKDPKKQYRAFALDLVRRGFVVLSMGTGASIYYPDQKAATLQPLSAMAYAAANAYHVLAARAEVDPARIGICGHSYGGKWAMFASCLYDKFAAAAWSDGGVVFDEKRGNVNFWEPWYLGYEPGEKPARTRGLVNETNPRTGAYKKLMAEGRDLHELHALMAPRPFLVSGGSEDQPERWEPLNHAVAVNKLLGHENRVAMTNRPAHTPTPESNEAMYLFFEHFLKP